MNGEYWDHLSYEVESNTYACLKWDILQKAFSKIQYKNKNISEWIHQVKNVDAVTPDDRDRECSTREQFFR